MLRKLLLVIPLFGVVISCVKPTSKDPVPIAEFVDFYASKKSDGNDTATMVLGYEDGDGDLFVSSNTEGPTVVITPYYYNAETNTLKPYVIPPNDTFLIPMNVKQPADGYYKGRSIKGTITLPMDQFRPSNSEKVFQFKGYLMDTKGNKSNPITSPIYTITF